MSLTERSVEPTRVAMLLLVAGLVRHYGYRWFPAEIDGEVWNICGAVANLVLVGLLGLVFRSWLIAIIGWWWALEELQVIGCEAWWLLAPWQHTPGTDRCSERLGVPLGGIGLAVVAWIAVLVSKKLTQGGRYG